MKKSIYIYQSGELKRKDNTLRFVNENGDKRDIPVNMVSEIYFFGESILNSKTINFLSQNQIIVHFYNYYDFYTSSLVPKKSKISGKLLVNQVEHYTNNSERLKIAKKFVKASSSNIYRNLRYYNSRGRELTLYMKQISYLISKVDKAVSINELMGIEGNIHKIYYGSWNIIINQEIDFERRVKRPPNNIVNTLISYLNSLVYTTVLSEILKTQLDPTISYLHEPGTSRYSLSLDIAEIFKPLIADRIIFSLLNKKQIQEKHFNKDLNYINLEEKGSKIILKEFDSTLKRTINHKKIGKKVSYRYLIRLECYKLIKYFLEKQEYEPFIIWW